jgi:glycosyltransferase involved in cell wall biosynthesis
MPLFSIILPCKSYSLLLERALSSCFAGNFNDFEIVVGLQNYPSFLQEVKTSGLFNDQRVRVLDTSIAKNLPENLNFILSHINSDYAVRLDDDDMMHPGRLTALHKEIDVISKYSIIGQGYIPLKGHKDLKKNEPIFAYRNHCQNAQHLLLGPCFAHPTITLNMRKITHAYNSHFDYAQDYKLYADTLCHGLFLGLDSVGTYYTQPDTTRKSYKQKRILQLRFHDQVMRQVWQLATSHEVDQDYIKAFRRTFISSEDSILLNESFSVTALERDKMIEAYKIALASDLFKGRI